MNLCTKYRPSTFDEMVGNEVAIKTLKNNLSKPSHSHVYLLSGPKGTGKTTASRIAAKELEATEWDIKEINCADLRNIEDARNIIEQMRYPPNGKAKVFILDECHQLTSITQSVLLKPLEEPPDYCYFFLCTTSPNKVIDTIKSRSTKINFKDISSEELCEAIRRIVKLEKMPVPKELFEDIAEKASGCARDAIMILNNLIGITDIKEMKSIIKEGSIDNNDAEIIELARALLDDNNKWPTIAKILKGLKDHDSETIRYCILGYMNAVLLNGSNNKRAIAALDAFSTNTYDSKNAGITLACINTIY